MDLGLKVESPLSKQEIIDLWALQAPMRRRAEPEEIAAAVAFLASERASHITGVTLQVDVDKRTAVMRPGRDAGEVAGRGYLLSEYQLASMVD